MIKKKKKITFSGEHCNESPFFIFYFVKVANLWLSGLERIHVSLHVFCSTILKAINFKKNLKK
jgi:hypothetical protein